jgi:GNAT superfamily N-acetyltransferase
MQSRVDYDLVITAVRTDSDLDDMIAVRARADPDRPPPRRENLRSNLAGNPELTYLVARHRGEPVGCGFVEIVDAAFAQAHVVVVPEERRRGVGSLLVATAAEHARDRGKTALQGEIRESDAESRAYFERRSYEIVGGEKGVALTLSEAGSAPAPPPGVEIASRVGRPDVVEGMYAVSVEAEADIPGQELQRSFEQWRANEIGRPTARPELCFVALAGDEVVGWAALDEYGADAHHRLTAVKRAWRRRGVATALKWAEIEAARARGLRRLVTTSEERNLPMRRLNEKLGYLPEPSLSSVLVRGPLVHNG